MKFLILVKKILKGAIIILWGENNFIFDIVYKLRIIFSPDEVKKNIYLSNLEKVKKRYILKSQPYNIHILLIDRCNANCPMCGFNYRNIKTTRKMDFDSYSIILNNLNPKRILSITFSGGGEPLLSDELEKMVSHTRRWFPSIGLSMITNGIAMNKNIVDMLVCDFSSIYVSINAIDRQKYKTIMGTDAFDRVLENIKSLVERKKKLKSKLKIIVLMQLSLINIRDLPEAIVFFKELKVDALGTSYVRFYSERRYSDNNLTHYDRYDRSLSLFWHKELSDTMIKKAKKNARSLGFEFIHPILFSEKAKEERDCEWSRSKLIVDTDGKAFPCCGSKVFFPKEINENIFDFGNFLNDNIEDIINKKDYVRLRCSSARNVKNPEIKMCLNCASLDSLKGTADLKEAHFIEL